MSQKLTVLQTASHSSVGPSLTCPHSLVYKLGSTFPLEPADGLPCQAAKPVTLGRLTSLCSEKASCSGGAVKSLLANDPTHTEGGGTLKRGSGGRQGCGEQGRGVRVCSEGTQEGSRAQQPGLEQLLPSHLPGAGQLCLEPTQGQAFPMEIGGEPTGTSRFTPQGP